jgi:hypothetical protein
MSFLRYWEAIRMMYIRKGRNQFGHARSHHPDEPPAGYSLASCAPALLASPSPAEFHFAPKPRDRQQILCMTAAWDYNSRAGDSPYFQAAAITLSLPFFCPKDGGNLSRQAERS